MKRCLNIILLTLLCFKGKTQQVNIDSLHYVINNAQHDSSRYFAARNLIIHYYDRNRDSALHFGKLALDLALRNGKKLNEAPAYNTMAMAYRIQGHYEKSLEMNLKAFEIAEDPSTETEFWSHDHTQNASSHREAILNTAHLTYAWLMEATGNPEQELYHLKIVEKSGKKRDDKTAIYLANMGIANIYRQYKKLDSALIHIQRALSAYSEGSWEKYVGNVYNSCGAIYSDMMQYDSAIYYFRKGIESGYSNNNLQNAVSGLSGLTKVYLELSQKDSSLLYAKKWVSERRKLGGGYSGLDHEALSYAYELNNMPDSAYKYLKLSVLFKDSTNQSKFKSLAGFQQLTLSEQLRVQNLEKEKVVYRNKIRTYFFLAGIGVLLLLAIIFYRNNRQKHKAKIKIEQAYDNLKATQQQLIQSEKMASLGELTAGIAHEIQNPLNFVNNFSEINTELVDELKTELTTGNVQLANDIADSIKENEQKIIHHGKRADAIVKNMLQHSRSSSGKKESTDINALADEYSRLAFHGLRAKDKSFNAKFETDFDPGVGKVNVIPQDIGRVVLNLINNAFYAVDEKKKQNLNGYEPTVSVSTRKEKDKVEIKVKDNGNGISQKVVDKIFQPFFTTKPTGQGTGLGLSLSYDIVKAHGGELKVNTKEGEGSEFIIQLN